MAQGRRATVQEVENDFDDDFDLPLPPRPVPSTVQQASIAGLDQRNTPAGGSSAPGLAQATPGVHVVTDVTPFKTWTCVYPIYIDAKRPYGTGRRRVAREKSCWWPHSQLIADAARRLRLPTFHEPDKTHPRDWENPGRVKVLFKDNGQFTNRNITTKKRLLEAIAETIQAQYASQTPLPEQTRPSLPSIDAKADSLPLVPSTLGKKGTPAKSNAQSGQTPPRRGRQQVIKPPEPLPPMSERYGTNSPLVEAGVLVETVKVALKQQAENDKKALEGPAGSQPGTPAGKGKRKVVRVRG